MPGFFLTMSPTLLLVLGGIAFLLWLLWRTRPAISPDALRAALHAGTAVLIDVREPAEWATATAQDAALLPLSDLRGDRHLWKPFLEQHRAQQLFLYCQSGTRSAIAAALLRREGFSALNAGSLTTLAGAGWPLGRRRS